MKWVFNDGGRAAAGFKGKASGDCVCRAIAIAAGMPYKDVYALINELNITFPPRGTKKQSSARTGCSKKIIDKVFERLGWPWTPTMGIGTGCTVHLRDGDLPMGTLICNVSGHLVAVIDGVIHDNQDCSRNGTRCVYGYWRKP